MNKNQFIIDRVNQEPFVVNRGDTVKVMLNNEKWVEGKVTGISHANGKIRIDGLWHDYGFIYRAETKPEEVPSIKNAATLSKVLKHINKKNEPPGGWNELDKLKPL